MPAYLLQVAYTPQALSALIANPHDRTQALKKNVRNLGGKMVGSWFAFGEYDLVAIMEFPDNVSAAAWALATAAGGALKSVKTTPLLSIEEGLEALRKVPESKLPVDRRVVANDRGILNSEIQIGVGTVAMWRRSISAASHGGR